VVQQKGQVGNPIDAFVLAKLEQKGLRLNPQADKLTLLRRVTFDLTGLFPTQAEREAFLADTSADAYEKLVDRLLRSPRFGERWAQHWLDGVRFAETEGFKSDRSRPDAYRYRDYVVRAFNDDLPYDRFIRQQLAGDELEPDNPDAVIATGLFRLPPGDSTASNFRAVRQDILNDNTDVFGVTFLGLTLGCARCHDHKFDPITQTDYYRLQAFLTPLVPRDDLSLAAEADRARYERELARWNEATHDIRADIARMLEPIRKEVFAESLVSFDPDTQTAMKTLPQQQTALQQQLAALAFPQVARKYTRMHRRLTADQKTKYEQLQKALASFDHLKPEPLPTIMAVTDSEAAPPPTHRLAGGNYLKPRDEVQPGFPECLDSREPQITRPARRPTSSGRRSALALWLCQPDHPLTSRVMVNRLWQHHLGQGIVATPNDFGVMGTAPTHPELLDFLATELVRQGWKLKPLHRLIVTSATYRQVSQPERNLQAVAATRIDPENRLLWHARVKRREAESIRDGILQLSGQLNLRMYGPSAHPYLPPLLAEARYSWNPDPRQEDQNRRSIYVFADRNFTLPLFRAFDVPDRINSCPVRATTITAPQSLVMLNGDFTLSQARLLAAQLLSGPNPDTLRLVRRAYQNIFSRNPDDAELAAAKQFLDRQTQLLASGSASPGSRAAREAAVTDFCHALLNSAEFLYIE